MNTKHHAHVSGHEVARGAAAALFILTGMLSILVTTVLMQSVV
jgi:hypothetical protein